MLYQGMCNSSTFPHSTFLWQLLHNEMRLLGHWLICNFRRISGAGFENRINSRVLEVFKKLDSELERREKEHAK